MTFQPGNKHSVGNSGNNIKRGRPHVILTAEYRLAIMEAGSVERVKNVVDKLYERATADPPDLTASKLILEHWGGKPTQSIDVTKTDVVNVKVDITRLIDAIYDAFKDDIDTRRKIAGVIRTIDLGEPEILPEEPKVLTPPEPVQPKPPKPPENPKPKAKLGRPRGSKTKPKPT